MRKFHWVSSGVNPEILSSFPSHPRGSLREVGKARCRATVQRIESPKVEHQESVSAQISAVWGIAGETMMVLSLASILVAPQESQSPARRWCRRDNIPRRTRPAQFWEREVGPFQRRNSSTGGV
jgi:hypothetical protein